MSGFEQEDIAFPAFDGASLTGTLYRPSMPAPVPLLLDVHGGAWVNGDRFNNAAIHRRLAEAGIAVLAIDFRMPPDARYPVAARDVNAAIRWLFANTGRCGSTPERVGGLGTSSGAHLLLLSALSPADPRWASAGDDPMPRLGYVVAGWPILDPLARYRMAQARNLSNLVEAHEKFWPDPEAMAQANPQLLLERGEHRHLPRLLLLQGTADQNVEHERAGLFAGAYRAAGGDIRLQMYEGEPHAFMLTRPESPAFASALTQIIDFVREAARPHRS